MAQKVKVLTGALGTGSTTDITSSGFGTPDGAIIFISGKSTATDTDSSSDATSIVFFDGTTTVCLAERGASGYDYTTTASGLQSSVKILLYNSDSWDAEGTLSNITDGIRISWSNTCGSSWRYVAVLFGGGVSCKVGTVQNNASEAGTTVYSSASFTPQAGLFVSANSSTHPNLSSHAVLSFGGFTYKSSTITQRTYGFYDPTNYDSSAVETAAVSSRVFCRGVTGGGGAITAVSSSGFTIRNDSANSVYSGFMLLGGLGDISLDDTPLPSSTGTKSWEGPGFQPNLILMLQSGMESYTSASNEDGMCAIAVADGTTSAGIAVYHKDYAPTQVVYSRANSSSAFLKSDQSGYYGSTFAASFTDFDSLGYNLNYTGLGSGAAGDIGFTLAIKLGTADVSAALTGGYGQASRGTIAPGSEMSMAGSYAPGTAGALSPAIAATAAGSAGSALGGSIAVATDAGLSGAGAAASPGSLAAAIGLAVSGAGGSAYAGTLVPEMAYGLLLDLSGSSGLAYAGAVAPDLGAALAGVSTLAHSGGVSAALSAGLIGADAAAQRGQLVASALAALAGQVGLATGGVIATGSAVAAALEGSLGSALAGSVSLGITAALAGGYAAAYSGILTSAASIDLSGAVALVLAGDISIVSSEVVVALFGASSQASAGALVGSLSLAISGSATTASPGSMIHGEAIEIINATLAVATTVMMSLPVARTINLDLEVM